MCNILDSAMLQILDRHNKSLQILNLMAHKSIQYYSKNAIRFLS